MKVLFSCLGTGHLWRELFKKMESASGDWLLVTGEQGRERVLFSTVHPFLDTLSFVFYKKCKKEEIYSAQNIFLYYMLNCKYSRKMLLKELHSPYK